MHRETPDEPKILAVNMNEFCREETCDGVISGIVAYWDHSHLSNTMAEDLAKPLDRLLKVVLDNDKLFGSS